MADGTDHARLDERTARWWEEVRAIPAELAANVGFFTSRDGNPAMTFYRDGQPVFVKVRYETPGRKREKSFKIEWLIPEGPDRVLSWWNDPLLDEPLLKPTTPLIVTEGEPDAASFLAAGMGAISVPNGTTDKPGEGDVIPAEDTRFGYLWRGNKLDPRIDRYKQIIIATDDDHAGRILRDELAIRLGRKRCWFVVYPTAVIADLGRPAKDANEVLVHLGADALTDMIADAKPIVPNRLVPYSDVVVAPREPHHPGWKGLEPFMKLVRPELCVFTGPPGAGKSQFALNVHMNLAHYHGWKTAILQFEDNPERNRRDLLRYRRHRLGRDAPEADVARWVDDMFRVIVPDENVDELQDVGWLEMMLEEAATRHGCKAALIDPWNEIEHLFAKGQTEAQYLNDAVRRMKRISRRHRMLISIVAHPDKASGQDKDIQDWSLYSMSGGAVWNNKADHGVVVLRNPEDTTEAWVKIAKSKDHAVMGVPGIVRMRFNPTAACYEFVAAGVGL